MNCKRCGAPLRVKQEGRGKVNRSGFCRRCWRQDPAKRKAYESAYREKNAEKIREYQARWRRERRIKDPERVRAYARARYQKNKEKILAASVDYHRRRAYGVDRARYEAMIAAQGGRCAICGSDRPGNKSWSVDHDHETGAVRAILCHKCNLALGAMNDDPERLIRAAMYVAEHRAKHYRVDKERPRVEVGIVEVTP